MLQPHFWAKMPATHQDHNAMTEAGNLCPHAVAKPVVTNPMGFFLVVVVLFLPQTGPLTCQGRNCIRRCLDLAVWPLSFPLEEVGRPVSVLVEQAGHLSTQKAPSRLTRNSTSFLMALCCP